MIWVFLFNKNMNYADVVSTIALIAAVVALVWNIIRDVVSDKTSIKGCILFGEKGNIKNSQTNLFAEAGSIPNHKFDNPKMLIKIINTGRRPVVVSGIGIKFKDNTYSSMLVKNLPKMLEPYASSSEITEINNAFLNKVVNNEIEEIWVRDAKDKKWFLSEQEMKKMKRTADYVYSDKHI